MDVKEQYARFLLWKVMFWQEAHDLPRGHFFQHQVVPHRHSPTVYAWPTYEIRYPYRTSYSFIFRLPFSQHALVLGRWWRLINPDDPRQVESHLLRVLAARKMGSTYNELQVMQHTADEVVTTEYGEQKVGTVYTQGEECQLPRGVNWDGPGSETGHSV